MRRAATHGQLIAVLGKAITHTIELLMISSYLMSEKGSAYIPKAAAFAKQFQAQTGVDLRLRPIFRLRFSALDALADIHTEFQLPAYLQPHFGTDWISGVDFARTWRQVVEKSAQTIRQLSGPSPLHHLTALQSNRLLGSSASRLLSSIQAHLQQHAANVKACFASINQDVHDPASKQQLLATASAARQALAEQDNPDLFNQLFNTLTAGLETKRAQLLRQHLAVTVSLPYWNCRPFVHWIDAIPGWYEAIRRRLTIVPDQHFPART